MRIPDTVHHELLNWSRWCWMGSWPHPIPPSECGSLESQYRPPPYWNPDDRDMPPLMIRANPDRARVVQVIYDDMLEKDQMAARVLKAEYPGRQNFHGRAHAAATLGLPMAGYEAILRKIIGRVEDAFAVRA